MFSFAETLENVCVHVIDEGQMTKDLAACIHGLKVGYFWKLNFLKQYCVLRFSLVSIVKSVEFHFRTGNVFISKENHVVEHSRYI